MHGRPHFDYFVLACMQAEAEKAGFWRDKCKEKDDAIADLQQQLSDAKVQASLHVLRICCVSR